MIREAIAESVFVSLIKKTQSSSSSSSSIYIEEWLNRTYQGSLIFGYIKTFWSGMRINFRYSLPGRISRLNFEYIPAISDYSFFCKLLLYKLKSCEERFIDYSKKSFTINAAETIKKELCILPVKTGSSITIIAVIINILTSGLLHKEISLQGWIIRLILFTVGSGGLFCNVEWKELKKTSNIIKYFRLNDNEVSNLR